MNVESFEQTARADGILPPDLPMLSPDAEYYTVLAFQPEGRIKVEDDFIGNAEARAATRFTKFLDLAVTQAPDLAVTPEYSCPWDSLLEAVEAGKAPAEGKIWVLGCESARPADLTAYSGRLTQTGFRVYAETLAPNGGTFVDPVCILFQTRDQGGAVRKVAVIQFKTVPSADGGLLFERDRMIQGQKVYSFSRPRGPSLRLATIICSDALGLPDAARQALADSGLILHLQLNPKPREAGYALYRSAIYASLQRAHVFALNWAARVETTGKITEAWGNESFSALYWRSVRSERVEDDRYDQNHPHGLYWHYWTKGRIDACVLNYAPAVFHFRMFKPDQQLAARQNEACPGPLALGAYEWREAEGDWRHATQALDDGVRDQLARVQGSDCSCLTGLSPLSVDRLLALSTGRARTADWYRIRKLPLGQLDSDEVSHRISFAQDFHERATSHRDGVLQALGQLAQILAAQQFPLPIRDLQGNSALRYDSSLPWFNLHGTGGGPPATVVYLGHNPAPPFLEAVKNDMRQFLESDQEQGRRGDPRRLVLCYHDNAGQVQMLATETPTFDEVKSEQSPAIDKAS